jgi:hypothetical protein
MGNQTTRDKEMIQSSLDLYGKNANSFIVDGFKPNVLMDMKPVEHILLTILASVGRGKWGERGEVTISLLLAGTVVDGSDCTTWRRAVFSWGVGYILVVVVFVGQLAWMVLYWQL